MEQYSGFLLLFDEPRRRALLAHQQKGPPRDWRFTDTVSTPDWEPHDVELCFLALTPTHINFAALARRGRAVASAKAQIVFTDFVPLPNLALGRLQAAIRVRLLPHTIRSASGYGRRVPPAIWTRLFTAIKELCPEQASELDDLDRLRQSAQQPYGGPAVSTVAWERDAVGVALDVFGAKRASILARWSPSASQGIPPFVKGLGATTVREDSILGYDAATLPGWAQLKRYVQGIVTFAKRSEYLTVVNVNRTPLETTLGVDLIYYHHVYKSYVLVQYKRMLKESTDFVYRPTDKSYSRELERMRAFRAAYPDSGAATAVDAYRLDPSGFYFKLCPAETITPLDGTLVEGKYYPLAYWELLTSDGALHGTRGGLRVANRATKRHFSNTLFVNLVQAGWIGTRGVSSVALTAILSEALDNGRSVILASSGETSRGRR